MKFSKLEQDIIRKLCDYFKSANKFRFLHIFIENYGLKENTGIISFDGKEMRVIFDFDEFKSSKDNDKYNDAFYHIVTVINLIEKLKRERYINSIIINNKESVLLFNGRYQLRIPQKTNHGYKFICAQNDDVGTFNVEFNYDYGEFILDSDNGKCIFSSQIAPVTTDAFLLFNSKIALEQELYELVSNDFKTYEEIQLEEAQKQTKIASESLEEARNQTNAAKESLEEAQKQTQKAQDSFKEAQKQTNLSFWAVILSVIAIIASIIVPRCTSSTLDQKQFDTIQMKQDELIKTLNEIKISQIDNDSLIKELNLANESIDEISNTLKELKKMNSKGK